MPQPHSLVLLLWIAFILCWLVLAQFPDAYPAYRRRTKMLIPFVF